MPKYKFVLGVDISKDFFDVVGSDGKHNQFLNEAKGFAAFLAEIPKRALVVMESTGYYHHQLAQFLAQKKIKVSVINPISVKRFRQMKLSKIKTDKTDAQAICEYAQQHAVPLYKIKSHGQVQFHQMHVLIEMYQKQRSALKNKLKGELAMGMPSALVLISIKRQLKVLADEILELEKEIDTIIKKLYTGQRALLESIPGIGPKTSRYLIMLTNGFRKFETSKQLCSYAGITPTIRQSGISIRGRSRISKVGNFKIRSLLFLCSFSAQKYNDACRSLFERITSKGKSKKLALIAVAHKLLRQAFAVAKNKEPYTTTYKHYSITNPKTTAYEVLLN